MKKVLIIDDSALMRRVLSDIIEEDTELEVSDLAKDGVEGLALLDKGKQYDLILLDIHMPKMNGVVFLEQLLERKLTVKVLIVSSVASRSTKETIRALELGAFDFVKKPQNAIGKSNVDFKNQLLLKSYLALGLNRESKQTDLMMDLAGENTSKALVSDISKISGTVISGGYKDKSMTGGYLVFIACSTGGPYALQHVIPKFPKDFPYPIVVVQHMPAGFTGSLASRLNEMSEICVCEAEDGQWLEPGNVYIAKGGHQCYLVQQRVGGCRFRVAADPPRNALRPCADVFLESLAETNFQEIICSVLTGMGDDGTRGLAYLRQYKKVTVIGQDKQSCVVYGMPKAAKEAGVVDEVKPLSEIADVIMEKIREIPV